MSPALSEFVTTAHSPATDPHLHVWGWEIPVYLFLGGFTAGIMVLSGWALWRGRRNPRSHPTFSLASSGLFMLGLATISLGMLALFLDLGHKPYVWRLYLTMKPWSPMSWGSWILLLVYPVLAAAVLLEPPATARPAAPLDRPPVAAPGRRPAGAARARLRLDGDRDRARHLHRHPALGPRRAAAVVERPPRPALPGLRPLVERRLRPLGLARAGGAAADGLARQPVPRDRARPHRPAPDRPRLLDRGPRRGRAAPPRRPLHGRLLGRRRGPRHRRCRSSSSPSPSPTASSTRRSRRSSSCSAGSRCASSSSTPASTATGPGSPNGGSMASVTHDVVHEAAAEKARVAQPYMNPYLAGIGLGLVLLAAFVLVGRGLGASGAFNSTIAWLVSLVAPGYARSNEFLSALPRGGHAPAQGLARLRGGRASSSGALLSGLLAGRVGVGDREGPARLGRDAARLRVRGRRAHGRSAPPSPAAARAARPSPAARSSTSGAGPS